MSPLLLFLLVMVSLSSGVSATRKISRPDYARDTGLPDKALTKYEKSGWLYRQLMERDPYYEIPPKHIAHARKLDEEFGKRKLWVKPGIELERAASRDANPLHPRIRLAQPQQAQWMAYRNPAYVNKKFMTKEEYAQKVFASNPYLQYFTGGQPMDTHTAVRSLETGSKLGPSLDEIRTRMDNAQTRVIKPLARQFQGPLPWETYDSFSRRVDIPKRLVPIPFLDKANARREAANKVFGHKNPPGLMHWPQSAPAHLLNAENYALGNKGVVKILENGGVRAAINSDNPMLSHVTFKHYDALDRLAPARTKWETAELVKDSQGISEAFKWERLKDKMKDTNSHIMAHLRAAGKNLPDEFNKNRRAGMRKIENKMKRHGRYHQNEMHAERNMLFRRQRVPGHPLQAAYLASMLFEDGMKGHWPHIDDKDNRHYGVPSPYAGGKYDGVQSTFNQHGPFRNWAPDRLSSKCIGASFGHADANDCFVNGQGGAGWGMWPKKHSIAHPDASWKHNSMQFMHEDRDNARRKGIKAGTSQHEIEQKAQRDFVEEEEFQYPQRYSAVRRDDTPPFKFTGAQRDIQKKHKNNSSKTREDSPEAFVRRSSTYSKLAQQGAPRSRNWNLQFVQDFQHGSPKTLGVFRQKDRDPRKGLPKFVTPPPNLQASPDHPKMEMDHRHPSPTGGGPLNNPMAGIVFKEENRLQDKRSFYKKTYGSDPHAGLHSADPGIPDIIMEGAVFCFGEKAAYDAQISLFSGTDHVSSAFTDKKGHFKLATTMQYNPHTLHVEIFHQCKESTDEKLIGKGEVGTIPLPLKYGDRRVYDLGKIDASESKYNWKRVKRPIEGTEFTTDTGLPLFAKLRPCPKSLKGLTCVSRMSDANIDSDVTDDEDAIEGENLFGMHKDEEQFVPSVVRN